MADLPLARIEKLRASIPQNGPGPFGFSAVSLAPVKTGCTLLRGGTAWDIKF